MSAAGTAGGPSGFVSGRSDFDADDEGKAAGDQDLRGWAIFVLREPGAVRECEEYGWMQDRGDPHARERALVTARHDPLPGVSPNEAVAEVREVMDLIGDSCPECSSTD